ncbi:MAG: FadR/GntR family transcriptional regulator [Nocardioidaceae bacterium]
MEPRSRGLVPIERMQVFRQVLDEITAYIDDNDLQPGDRLPGDRDFVSALKVSRPLVQQALKVLEGLGRVTIVHGLGTFVADEADQVLASALTRGINDGDALTSQLLRARELIDREVIRCAYQHGDDGLIDELQRILDERQSELADEPEEASLDLDFEAAFGRFCGNEVLGRLQSMLHHAWLQTQIDEDIPLADRFALHHEHGEILEALKEGDMDAALELFEKHVRQIRSWT